MAFPNDQLFLNRFIAFNKSRYADNPDFVAQLNALTLDKISFTNFRTVEVEPGVIAHLYDVDSPNLLTGDDQRYLPADYVKNGTAQLAEPDPVELSVLQAKAVQGIFFLGTGPEDSVGAVLVYNGFRTAENIKALVKENCFFELAGSDIVVNEDLTLVTIDSPTIGGILQVVEGLYDDVPRFNGQYRYDGTISY